MTNRDDSDPDEDWGTPTTPWQEPQQPQAGNQPPPPQQPVPGPPPPPQQQPWPGAPTPPPGQYPQGQWQWQGQRPTINNYMIPAVLATIFCFLPTGVAAIVFANQVNNKLNMGDFQGAQKASDNAKTWTIVSAVVGVVFLFIFIAASSGSA